MLSVCFAVAVMFRIMSKSVTSPCTLCVFPVPKSAWTLAKNTVAAYLASHLRRTEAHAITLPSWSNVADTGQDHKKNGVYSKGKRLSSSSVHEELRRCAVQLRLAAVPQLARCTSDSRATRAFTKIPIINHVLDKCAEIQPACLWTHKTQIMSENWVSWSP